MIQMFIKKANDLNLNVFAEWAVSTLADGAFLVVWVWVQWFVDQMISYFQLSWIDDWTLLLIQLLFAIGTLIPIVMHISVNMVRHLVEGWKAITVELKGLGKGS